MSAQPALSAQAVEQAKRAFALHEEGKLDAAAQICAELIETEPPFRDILHLRGLIDLKQGRPDAARLYLEQADALSPGLFNVMFQLALAYEQLGLFHKAEATWGRALESQPDNALLWIKRAYMLRKLDQPEDAGRCIDEALKLEPENPTFIHEKGYHLHHFERDLDAAEALYKTARDRSPDKVEAWVNYGLLCRTTGRWRDMKDRLSEAHRQFPDKVLPQYYYGIEQLRWGEFKDGWPNYEGRYQRPEVKRVDLQFSAPVWQGEMLNDKHLLFWTDQGIGEELLGLHIAAPQIAQAARSTIVCTRAVLSLVKRCFPHSEVISHESIWEDGPMPSADVQASFSQIAAHSLPTPEAAKNLPETITADSDLAASFRSKYRADQGSLIGFAWKSPKSKIASHKATNLSDWEAVFACPNARFVCLQYGITPEDKTWLLDRLGNRVQFDDSLVPGEDMDAWLAQVAAMDLVISVSTTTAHLAGVSRTPAWTLLTAGDGLTWYWFLDRSDSPWYPKTTLYRQSRPTEWAPVLQSVARDLQARVAPSTSA